MARRPRGGKKKAAKPGGVSWALVGAVGVLVAAVAVAWVAMGGDGHAPGPPARADMQKDAPVRESLGLPTEEDVSRRDEEMEAQMNALIAEAAELEDEEAREALHKRVRSLLWTSLGERLVELLMSERLHTDGEFTASLPTKPNGQNDVHAAVLAASAKRVRTWIELAGEGTVPVAALWAADEDGWTPLHFAAALGHVHITALLAAAPGAAAGMDTPNSDASFTPLHLAASEAHSDVVGALVAAGADMNVRGRGGRTPFALAVSKGHVDTAVRLAMSGADMSVQDADGLHGLALAVRSGSMMLTAVVAEKAPALVDAPCGVQAWTPLMRVVHACAGGEAAKIQVAEALLMMGAGLDVEHAVTGNTVLHMALEAGLAELARRLVVLGASLAVENVQQLTPVGMLKQVSAAWTEEARNKVVHAFHERLQTMQRVLAEDDAGRMAADAAEVRRMDERGVKHALNHAHSAFTNSDMDAMRAALRSLPDANAAFADATAWPFAHPLELAAKAHHVDMLAMLLSHGVTPTADATALLHELMTTMAINGNGADIRRLAAHVDVLATDRKHNTVLHAAAAANEAQVCAALLEAARRQDALAALLDARDHRAHSALFVAAYMNALDAAAVLLDAGGDVDAEDGDGYTPLFFAAAEGHAAAVDFLLAKGADAAHRAGDGSYAWMIALASGEEALSKQLRREAMM